MSFDPALEHPLEQPLDTPLWSENFALVFADEAARITALYSIGTWHHDPSVWRENLAVTLPDGQILVARNFGRNTCGAVVSASLSRYEVIESGQRARLCYDGPAWSHGFQQLLVPGAYGGTTRRLGLELEFVATTPLWDMHAGHEPDRTGVAGAMHIEQLGRCNGILRVDANEVTICDAVSCRDHSRGMRDVTNYRNHCWINGQFSGGRAFQLYVFRMHHIEGMALSLATVTQAGRQYPATVEHVEFVDAQQDYGRMHHIVLRSELGEMEIDVEEAWGTIPVTMTAPFNPSIGVVDDPHALIFDESLHMIWNGEAGFGWCERGFSRQPI